MLLTTEFDYCLELAEKLKFPVNELPFGNRVPLTGKRKHYFLGYALVIKCVRLYGQAYTARQLGVSRIAVHKWYRTGIVPTNRRRQLLTLIQARDDHEKQTRKITHRRMGKNNLHL